MKHIVVTLAILLLVLGCGEYIAPGLRSEAIAAVSASNQGPFTRNETVTVDGRTRTYLIHVPRQEGDGLLPLILALHGQ